jgi:uncharacterized protein YfaS (alpha-2-macroglobulin family)
MNVGNIGHLLVEQKEAKYIGKRIAAWDMDLKPRADHVDDRITVTTPLDKPGAYLLTAKMKDGNLSRIIVWVADSVIVKKQFDGKALYYVADAVTGKPLEKANVEFFGWKQVQVKPNTNQFRVETINFAENTDKDGQIILGENRMPNQNQWLIVSRQKDKLAYLGFSYVWFGQHYDPEYNQTKVFTITDRPVYRPLQTVQFKFWMRHAKYDQPNTSDFAGKTFTVEIRDPKNEKVFEKDFSTDEYGGIAGEFPISKNATLGVYGLYIKNHGGGTFRIEEYKKPEYEVTVEAPKEPVRLGDPITATIQAKYYFGAPVTHAKVKYKVTRTAYSSTWYPIGRWDWFYGKGYWWFCGDYPWYPGWLSWGCARPFPFWWGVRHEPPEVVLENEVAIGADGIVKVDIDTSLAKALHGDQDHKYTISAEVTDESRRTIVGTGDVLVARKPFRVFAWVNRGHFRAGDDIQASFKAQTLDGKPVQGTGELKLLKITYNEKNEPVEKVVETWKLDTNVEGMAQQQMKAAEAGQYRLSYTVWGNRPLPEGVKEEDRNATPIEGGYLFVVRGEGFDGKEFRFNDIELVTDKREYAPGDKVKLLINTNKTNSTVLLFLRPTNGIYLPPKTIRLSGRSVEEEIGVVQKDMPNFFIEALTIADGKMHTETRELVVPPEKRVLTVDVLPSLNEYRPGQKAKVKVKLTDLLGNPFVGSTVLTMYDKSVEYISGGSNVPEIKEFFWKWRRHHYPQSEASIGHGSGNLLHTGEIAMNNLGVFGDMVVEETRLGSNRRKGEGAGREESEQFRTYGRGGTGMMGGGGGPMAPMSAARFADGAEKKEAGADFGYFAGDKAKDGKPANGIPGGAGQEAPGVQPTVRKNFADTAFWNATLATDKDGIAEVELTMPENLTGWKVRVWAMGHGTKVGQGEAEVVTKKDLIVRLQAPRFFTQRDEVVLGMAKAGVQALQNMQCGDGGWGWFSGYGEHSWPHTTAVVVHGLQIARENDIAILPGVLERGVEWLKNYQAGEIKKLQNFPTKTEPYKEFADNIDAMVYMILVDGGTDNVTMRDFLYRDRTHLAVYAKAMFGLALHKNKQADKLAMILKNIEQFVVQDAENQTAYLKLPGDSPWWYWYGSEVEANAYYLKLLAKTSPKDDKASGLVKYLLNNRKHATYWNSTRDTALSIEAMAEYIKASGEDKPNMTVEVLLDGKKQKEVKIDASNLFTFDNVFLLTGDAVEGGKHTLEVRRKGTGQVYFNAYLTNFTLEDFITKAGLEVKVQRKFYKLTRVDKSIKVHGTRGQAADQKVEKYERSELPNLSTLKSGDLVEIELEIDSKNDYEYLIFEDMKASGFEPVEVRSGYNGNDMGAYMELRDDRVSFFVRALARGKHSVRYRLRAEIPGKFSALPTRASAMYAPELRGNSDEMKVAITD